MVAVLNKNLVRPSGYSAGQQRPDVLYFGAFPAEVQIIQQHHSERFDIRCSSAVPEFTSLVRTEKFTHIVLDLRDGRLAAKLLLPVLSSLQQPIDLIVVTTLNEIETYGLIPRNARILDGAIKERQLLRLLGLASVAPKISSPPVQKVPKTPFWHTPVGIAAILALTALIASATTLAVLRANSSSRIYSDTSSADQSLDQLKSRYERARNQLQYARQDVRRANMTLVPQLHKIDQQARGLVEQRKKLQKQLAFLSQAERAVITSRSSVGSVATMRARFGRSQISKQELLKTVMATLAFDQRSNALEQRQQATQAELAKIQDQLKNLAAVVIQLRSSTLETVNAKLRDAQQNLEILDQALKQRAS